MRKLLGDILIFIFCIVLMVNFGRFFFVPEGSIESFEVIDTFSILDAISDIDVDPSTLYNAVADLLGTVAGISLKAVSVFTLKWTSASAILDNILRVLTIGYDIVFNAGVVIAQLSIVIYQFVVYFINLFNAIVTLMNRVLGSVFRTSSVSNITGFQAGGDGYKGGGFGGRR